MKYANPMMTLLLAAAAILQLAEGEWVWSVAYGIAVLFSVLFALGRMPATSAGIFAGLCLVASLYSFAMAFIQESWTWASGFRESIGLFIAFVWISTLVWFETQAEGRLT